MPQYVRVKYPGGAYFFTVVTLGRQQIFRTHENIRCLMETVTKVQNQYPFILEAMVVLPDHLHALWTLPEEDSDYSKRWGLIKAAFSKRVQENWHSKQSVNPSRTKRRETSVWQRRFWEHAIRNEEDFHKHLDYIHYNPVKHGLVNMVKDWPYSSFHRHVRQGLYPENWGSGICFNMGDAFGE